MTPLGLLNLLQHLLSAAIKASLLFCIALLPAIGGAQEGSTSLVEDVWRAAHLDTLSDGMVKNLLTGIEQHPKMAALSPERRDRLIAHYRRHATVERFSRGLRTTLEQSPSENLKALLSLARSSIAQRALSEELAFEPVSAHIMNAHAARMRTTHEGRERAEAIERLDQAIGVTDMAVTVTATTLYGTAVAMREFEGATQTTAPPDLAELVSEFVEQARPWQAKQIQITYMYLYRNLPLADLNAYVAMQEDKPVRGIQRRFVRSLGEEMIAIQRDVMRDVIRDLRGHGERET